MGVYNPQAPRILGQEWVPIREENFQFQPDVFSREVGYSFTLTASRTINNVRWYVNQLPGATFNEHTAMCNIYPKGKEAASGPIRKVIIPANDSTLLTLTHGAINGASTAPEALFSPADIKTLDAFSSPGPGTVSVEFNLFFAANDYLQYLSGKRILNVSLLYSGFAGMINDNGYSVGFQRLPQSTRTNSALVKVQSGVAGTNIVFARDADAELGALVGLANFVPDPASANGALGLAQIARLNIGDITTVFPTAGGGGASIWTYPTLRRFDKRNGTDGLIDVLIQVPLANSQNFPTNGFFRLNYMALEITYCEETRVANGTALVAPYQQGLNTVAMYDMNLAANPVLAAGDYTVTLAFPYAGDQVFIADQVQGPFPGVNALREKYSLNTLPGVELDIPFPSYNQVGKTFTSLQTHIIPQLSVHTSSAPLTEPHAYGRQAVAQVYGTITATQNLLDSAVGTNQSFPWVRYYARRFGNTSTSLVLTGASPTVSGSSVSITPAQFDALDEILDGWREVTLRFPVAPVMGAGVTPSWTWSAAGETAGNRWEVLGAAAPAISGTLQSPYNNPGPASALLGTATYGQPSAGTTVELSWMPGISPAVSATTADPMSDATILFSQDMPAVSGMSVTTLNLALSGVAADCVGSPWYVPTAMSFNNINWSPTSTSVPLSGFGYYELQRMDTIDTTWRTIAKLESPNSFMFNDYEARVSILNSYRIRSVNNYLFPGPWSSTVTNTLTAPGVTGIGMGASSHTLLFSSNEVQNGTRSLAYALTNQDGTEPFTFPEAGFTQYQFMYGRDYQTAFRPLERGGTTFQRTVLVQAAAIPPPTLADFTSLRDMMWDSLSYVCVRDEDGNKWLSNVVVPSGRVELNTRKIYLADLGITEVTATPSQFETPYAVLDLYNRTSVASPGTADIGGPYTIIGGSASDYNVSNGFLNISMPDVINSRSVTLGSNRIIDATAYVETTFTQLATGGLYSAFIYLRRFDGSNFYAVQAGARDDGLIHIEILKRVLNVTTTISASLNVAGYVAGDRIGIRFSALGTLLRAKVWNMNKPEPLDWTVFAFDASLTIGLVGLRADCSGSNTNVNLVVPFTNFQVY